MTEAKKSKRWMKWAAGITAALVLLAVGGLCGAYLFRGGEKGGAATIWLDVNPSIEITVDENEEILEVTGKNEDGRQVIGDMNFAGSSLEVTVNALIGAMHRQGFLNEDDNSILVSVSSDDAQRAAALESKLNDDINQMMQTESFRGSVLSQTVAEDDQLTQLAESYGITLGKAQLIQQILDKNPQHTFDSLVGLNVNELNLLVASSGDTLEQVQVTGTASDSAYIGEEKAKEIALEHAGKSAADVNFVRVKLDYDDGRAEYEVEFYSDNTEYDYEIDATTGTILSYDHDAEGYTPSANTDNTGSGATENNGSSSSAGVIGEERAKEIALSHAGKSASDVKFVRVELDRDDGRQEYEVEFYSGNTEYDYEIDAATGKILSYDHDAEGYTPKKTDSSQTSGNGSNAASNANNTGSSGNSSASSTISEARAKEIALSHAGKSASDVKFVRVELDRDDGRKEYEVEFYSGNTEYDYEIDAATGKILSYDHDAEGYTPKKDTQSSSSTSGKTDSAANATSKPEGSQGSKTEYIGASAAKSKAFSHAGVSASAAYDVECELDRDDGRVVYEVEFKADGYEYSYEINATTGAIVSQERDRDD